MILCTQASYKVFLKNVIRERLLFESRLSENFPIMLELCVVEGVGLRLLGSIDIMVRLRLRLN